MARSGRFKKTMVNQEALIRESEELYPDLETEFADKSKPDPQKVAAIILKFQKNRHGKKYLGSRLKNKIVEAQLAPEIEVFNLRALKSLPLSVNRAVINWHLGLWNLKLIHHVPSALEMLEVQCKGSRFVTLFTAFDDYRKYHEHGRDAFSFLVHDLIHADHFFNDAERARAQIIFYQKLKNELLAGKYNNHLASSDFRSRFDYLIGDMNSHPAHLESYLEFICK